MPGKAVAKPRKTTTRARGATRKAATTTRGKRRRSSSHESAKSSASSHSNSSSASSNSRSSKASASKREDSVAAAAAAEKKTGALSKFEDFDVAEVMKEVHASGADEPVGGGNLALPSDAPMAHDLTGESALVTEVVPGVAAMPTAPAAQAEEMVPLAAVEAVNVPRDSEANNGLLREPAAPSKEIARVTKEGEGAPPMPTELMQLLSG